MARDASREWPKFLGPWTHMEDQEEAHGSSLLQMGPVYSLSLFAFVKKKKYFL